MQLRSAARALAALSADTAVCLAGRIVTRTADGFVLQDDTGCAQCLSSAQASVGAFARVVGVWDGVQLQAASVELLSPGNDRFMRGDSDFSQLIGKRLSNLRARHDVLRTIRSFLDAQGLLEVDTPAIVPCPGLDVHLDAIEVLGMGAPRWLHTSPEYQMKRLLSTGLPGVYQLGKAFRRGERGKLHEPEFTMLEWYRTFACAQDMMTDTEQLVSQIARVLTGGTRLPGIQQPVDVSAPWDRISVADAFQRYAGVDVETVVHDDDRFYRLLVEKVEPELGRGRATFLTDYPARMASLARLSAQDPKCAERFEAYVDGVELCNGFSELTDPAEQRKRLQADQAQRSKLGRSVYPIDERFMAALEDGLPPSGGNALGVDRLVMLALGAKQIDEVVAFTTARV
jgi:lysyl-tRNA synthetase class 2